MTERFPKLQLDDDADNKGDKPRTEEASGPQASKKKLPPPLPARRAEPIAKPAPAPAPEPAKAAKPPLPAARPAPAADPAAKPPPPPRAAKPAEPKAAAPVAAPAAPNPKAPAQRSSPGAYHLSTAPQPIRPSSSPAATPGTTEAKRPAPVAPAPATAAPAPVPATAAPAPARAAAPPAPAPAPPAQTAPKAPAATVPAMPAIKPAPAATIETPAKPPPPAAEAPPETAWFSSLLDASWSEESPSPAAAPALESKELPVSRVTSVASSESPATKSEASRAEPLESSLCAFWLAKRCFALDVALVGEVVSVDSVVPVPMTPNAFVGLFNLRGTPMALVDLAQVLELDERAPQPVTEARSGLFALVFRSSRLTAAAVIDKMEAVLPAGRESFTRPENADNPLVTGFVEVRHRPGLVVTVLDPARVIERLERLKYA